MKPIFSFCIAVLATTACMAQNYARSLYGFQLEQYREATYGELGDPYEKNQHEDGMQYDIFILNADYSLYMIFEYLPSEPGSIYSIQITGTDGKANLRFKGLHFGDSAAKVEQVLGKPSQKTDVGKYGTQWDFENVNYNLEINPDGMLSSIKIKNNFVSDGKEVEKIPDFKNTILPKLTSGKNEVIATLLAPDVEVFTIKDKVFYFTKSFDTEIKEDSGNVYNAIKIIIEGLEKVNTSKTESYEENIRLVEGLDPMLEKKKHDPNTVIKEIVFKYVCDKWLIWEIKPELE